MLVPLNLELLAVVSYLTGMLGTQLSVHFYSLIHLSGPRS